MANINLDPGSHYWTGVTDRPNSDAGTEGMVRELYEYQDMFGPNEIVAPIAVIYEYPETVTGVQSVVWVPPVPPIVPVVPFVPVVVIPQPTPTTLPEPVPEPGTALLLATAFIGVVIFRRIW
jgi:hypothetical protein